MIKEEKQLTLRERNKLRTRNELRAAALELFRDEGFAGSSVDKIARLAGTSKGTVYVYFPGGLDDIYREIYVDLSEQVLSAGIAGRDAQSEPAQRILALVEALLELCAKPEYGSFYSLLSPVMQPVLAPVLGQASREFTVMMAEDLGNLRASASDAEARVLAELLVGAAREAAKIVSETPSKKNALLAGLEDLVSSLAGGTAKMP